LIQSEGALEKLHLKEMLAVVRLDSYRTKVHRVPMLIDILLPVEQSLTPSALSPAARSR
jgi:hypothetical protein